MEIDNINLEDEGTSQVLLKYLSGEIPFHEWLNLQSQSGPIISGDVGTPDGGTPVGEPTASADDYIASASHITSNIDDNSSETLEGNAANVTESLEDKLSVTDYNIEDVDVAAPDSSVELFHPSIASFPKRMTELLLLGKKPVTTKSVDEFMTEIPLAGVKKKKKKRKRMNELTNEHRQLMGEINMCFVRNEFDRAWNLCEELIKKAPHCPDPFQTLAFICEEKNDPVKAHQYKLIAAHLGASDCEEWLDLAQTSINNGNYEEAIVCYTEAGKKDPTRIDILMSKAAMYEKVGQTRKKMEVFDNILKIMPEEEHKRYFVIAKDVAQLYHGLDQSEKAIATLDKAFKKYPSEIKFEDVNILTELYMSNRKFQKAFQVICQYCDVELIQSEHSSYNIANVAETLTEEDLAEDKLTDAALNVPDTLPVDLRAKMVVCLIQSCAGIEKIQYVVVPLFDEPVEEVGDLYLDIADAYCEMGHYEEALGLLNPLVKTERFSQAAVWLKKAECLATLGQEHEAVEAYSWVIALAPGHSEARFTLSALYQRLGQTEKALQVLEEMPRDKKETAGANDDESDEEIRSEDESTVNTSLVPYISRKKSRPISNSELKLLYHRSLLLYSQKKVERFLESGIQALSRYFADVYYDKDLQSGENIIRNFKIAMIRMRKSAEETSESLIGGIVADIRREEWWELFVKVAKTLQKVGRHSEMEYIVKCAMSTARFSHIRAYQRELDFLGVSACFINGSLKTAFNIIRVVINRNRDCKHLWNIFVRLVVGSGDQKHQKFCLRQLLKDPHSVPLQMINGHNALVSGNYKYALGEYARVFRMEPWNPLISLLIGLSYLQLACQKFASRRNYNIVQAFLFFYQYENLQGRCQETDYNLGRSYHQLGLHHFASHYYHRALEYPFLEDNEDEEFWDKNNLHREAAINLSMIYRHSGNNLVARELLQKYCTI